MSDGRLTTALPAELAGERLDKVVAVLGELSRAEARRLVDADEVTVGGVVRPPRWKVEAGDEISFRLPEDEADLAPVEMDLDVRYEDEHVLVVDKPAGLVVHPGAGSPQPTLAAGVLWRYPGVEGVGQPERWGIVHRLDRDTSGLMVVALTGVAHAGLVDAIRAREVDRRYLALVDGGFEVASGTVDAPIGRDPNRPLRRRVAPNGKPARTHYEVIGDYVDRGVSMLAVTLETGRTHQIRVHMAAIDHPVVGDRLYRPGPDRIESPRMFLHADRLGFHHPVSGSRIDVTSPLPDDLAAVVHVISAP